MIQSLDMTVRGKPVSQTDKPPSESPPIDLVGLVGFHSKSRNLLEYSPQTSITCLLLDVKRLGSLLLLLLLILIVFHVQAQMFHSPKLSY